MCIRDSDQTIDVSEGCATEFFADQDGDGFGDPSTGVVACIPPKGFVPDNTDCTDDDENNFPGNLEVCDGVDNDCNDEVDEVEECVDGSSSSGNASGGEESSGGDPTSDSGTTTGPVDPTTADTTDGEETDTDDGAGASGGGGGCAVSNPSNGAAFLLMLLGLGVAPLARRRKRC